MIVETTNYFARPGQARAVLEQRLKASRIRRKLGLPPGRILTRVDGDGPDVRWECEFADRAAHDRDLEARKSSAEFESCRVEMRDLVERFERHVHEVVAEDRP